MLFCSAVLFYASYLSVPLAIYGCLSCDKCTSCKSLWIKASAECPKCNAFQPLFVSNSDCFSKTLLTAVLCLAFFLNFSCSTDCFTNIFKAAHEIKMYTDKWHCSSMFLPGGWHCRAALSFSDNFKVLDLFHEGPA